MPKKMGGATSLALLLLLEGAAAVVWGVALLGALADRRVTRSLECAADDETLEQSDSVTLIVPVRNESKNIDAWIDAALAQRDVARILVADDSSEDDTAQRAGRHQNQNSRLEVLRCSPPPAGWVGKSWAAYSAALCSTAPWLLFSDADARMQRGTVSAALRAAQANGADALSLTPALECSTTAEAIVMPAMAALIFGAYPICLIEDDRFATALMWGGFMLVRREAYWRVGGHWAVRGDIAEDRALAQRLKAFGYPICMRNGSGCVRVRMYAGFPEMWFGWRKNVYAGVHRQPLSALGFIALNFAMLVAPLPILIALCATVRRRRLTVRERQLRALSAFGYLCAIGVRWLRDPLIGARLSSALFTPLAGLFVCSIMAASAWRGISGAGQTWKGRTIRS